MTDHELLQQESSRRSNWDDQIKQAQLSAAIEAQEMNLFVLLKPRIYLDGNQWCVAYGPNPHEGIYGFGDTIRKAIWNFNEQLDRP